MQTRAIFTLLASLSLAACETSEAVVRKTAEPVEVLPVAVIGPTAETITREVVVSGEFRPYQSVDLHAKVAGYIKAIHVDIGDRVAAGQQIAVLEIPEMAADLAHAAADRKRAAANLKLVGVSYERLASVEKSGHRDLLPRAAAGAG
jgi:multidrug efflux pump subunit AcrA (membrane-fusion protein)